MRLKIYQAPNIGAAMAMVRDELGPDALILANRTVDGGVEVTAAQESEPIAANEAASPAPGIGRAAGSGRPSKLIGEWVTAPVATPLTDMARSAALRWHGVPNALAGRLGRGDLIDTLETELQFASLPCRADDPPLLLVGPPGAGKTITTARLATRLKLAGKNAQVITADGRRAGAAEQLAAFTRLLGLTLIVADEPRQLARAVARRQENEPVIVDMPGLSPFDPKDQDYVRGCQEAIGATVAIVLPAGLDPADAEDLAQGFKALGATMLVATRLDQSRRMGGLLAAADTGLAFTDAGINAGVADGMTKVTPDFLAGRLSVPRQSGFSPFLVQHSPSSLALLARQQEELPRSEP